MNNKELEKKVISVAGRLLYKKGYVGSVDVLLEIGYISAKDYGDWRAGRVDYLERVCRVNLKKLGLINKTIRVFAAQNSLKESWTAYMKYGKGSKKRLQFSKSGDANIERAYSTHYLLKKEMKERSQVANNDE